MNLLYRNANCAMRTHIRPKTWYRHCAGMHTATADLLEVQAAAHEPRAPRAPRVCALADAERTPSTQSRLSDMWHVMSEMKRARDAVISRSACTLHRCWSHAVSVEYCTGSRLAFVGRGVNRVVERE